MRLLQINRGGVFLKVWFSAESLLGKNFIFVKILSVLIKK